VIRLEVVIIDAVPGPIYKLCPIVDRAGAALALTFLLGLVACSQRGSAPSTSTGSTAPSSEVTDTTMATTTTSVAPTTTSVALTTTTGPSQTCVGENQVPVDPEALAATSVAGDVDGDGFEDMITGYLLGSEDPAAATGAVLHVELASGYTTAIDVAQLGLGFDVLLARPEKVVSMSGDQLIVAAIAGILPGELFGFFLLDDCELSVVDTADGEVPEIWFGGGATHDDWFSCGPESVTMARFGYSDGTVTPRVYETGHVEEFGYEAATFTVVGGTEPSVTLPAPQEDVLAAYPHCVR
jgi:hypothetical protein